jgi:GTP-binding protein HflX
MAKLQETKKPQETCVLVGIVNKKQNLDILTEYLDELAFLATTADAFCVKRYWQNLDHPDNRTFVGSGKIEEIKNFVFENEVDMVIIRSRF